MVYALIFKQDGVVSLSSRGLWGNPCGEKILRIPQDGDEMNEKSIINIYVNSCID